MNRTTTFLGSLLSIICLLGTLFLPIPEQSAYAKPKKASSYSIIILSHYSKSLAIGDEFDLIAVSSSTKRISFKSSKSSVASVNSYGHVIAKKSGTAVITAKNAGGEASCRITVTPTNIQLSSNNISLDVGYYAKLDASSSNGHPVTFRSSRSSIATISSTGKIFAKKPGITTVTVCCDDTKITCKIWVKSPIVTLSSTSVTLSCGETTKLTCTSTSRSMPKWKTSKKSVATVDVNGTVSAIKRGSAAISVTIDGVTKSCIVTVE
ncbi:MAG: Ig-like domain-containing protein [Clostridiales bacterium]|nr:Ig-like domain-containing protein [Clostridiales bacterium]